MSKSELQLTAQRLRATALQTRTLDDIADYITKYTFLNNVRYSYKDHEFQETIARDTSRIVNIQKCSQIGLSELLARYTAAFAMLFDGSSIITTFPTTGDAESFGQTRFDPMIQNSPELAKLMSKDVWSTAKKRLGNSLIYYRGTLSETAALSIPADGIISDEIDRSNPEILKQYASRLTHSQWRLRRNFSTPTYSGRGISAEMAVSRRFRNLCKCHHCNHFFVPDYETMVKIPGFDRPLREITAANLQYIDHKSAALLCPKCGLAPDLSPQHREWVQENSTDTHEAAGYYVSPFDAPKIISTPYLVATSTEYTDFAEFQNQNLGLTTDDSKTTLTEADIRSALTESSLTDSGGYYLGADMGLLCPIVIGRIQNNELVVVHREVVPLSLFEQRKRELQVKYRIFASVLDANPYTDLILRIQTYDKTMYGAIFSQSKSIEVYKVKEQDEETNVQRVRQVDISKDKALDQLADLFKTRAVRIHKDADDEQFITQMLDMKRGQVFDRSGDLVHKWVKSTKGNDHYHHALLYLLIACRLKASLTPAHAYVPLVGSFRPR